MVTDKPRKSDPRKWAFLAVALSLIGVLIAMGGKLADSKLIVFAGAFMIVATMLFGVLGAYLVAMRPRPRLKRTSIANNPAEPELLQRADTTNKLLPIANADDFIPTVTEATTDLLTVPASNRSEVRD